MKNLKILFGVLLLISQFGFAAELKVGNNAPGIQLKTDSGTDFNLQSRKGQWTVLYFYPKAETPGCTTQACTFSDKIKNIRDEGAEVYGISADTVTNLLAFKKNHNLKFPLLADPELVAIKAYGTKMPVMALSKRWTFIINPALKIASVERNVDPIKDAVQVTEKLKELKRIYH